MMIRSIVKRLRRFGGLLEDVVRLVDWGVAMACHPDFSLCGNERMDPHYKWISSAGNSPLRCTGRVPDTDMEWAQCDVLLIGG
ncbi:MAG: hypothetical protein VX644_17090 [Planctomycetota bacterium]|nr:hypothetical protein [Planctomycetota bacterium]